MSGNSGCLGQQVMGHRANQMPCNRCPDGLCRQEMISSIANTGYARWRPSPSLIRNPKSQAESPNIIYEVSELPPRLMSERGPSAWAHPLEEGAIGFAVFDHSVYGARHLGRDRGVGLAAQMPAIKSMWPQFSQRADKERDERPGSRGWFKILTLSGPDLHKQVRSVVQLDDGFWCRYPIINTPYFFKD